MITFENYIKDVQDRINPLLSSYISAESCRVGKRVAEAMSYSLMIGGKRIRPALCISAAEAIGGSADRVMLLACAIEMIHTYSLIHDDLPSMDNDVLRRGKLTCHEYFDEATAILAGDALLTLAFEVLAKIGLNSKNTPSRIIFEVIHKMAISSGFRGMIGGQMQDINYEGVRLSQNELKDMHVYKTGMMMEAAVTCGAIMSLADNHQLDQLRDYACNLGLAYQITDDILNVVGNSSNLGKSVGTDSARTKNTYPLFFGLAESKKIARHLIDDALNALELFDYKANPLRIIACYILERNK